MIHEFMAICSTRETMRSRFLPPEQIALNAALNERRKVVREGYQAAQVKS